MQGFCVNCLKAYNFYTCNSTPRTGRVFKFILKTLQKMKLKQTVIISIKLESPANKDNALVVSVHYVFKTILRVNY
jgi:hypothetical protein